MMRWFRSFATFAVVAGLSFAIAGCNNTPTSAKADKMGSEKMSGDKMGGDKMGGDKMGGDKMGGEKMKEKPGS